MVFNNTSEKMSLNLRNCSHNWACLAKRNKTKNKNTGEKVPYEINTLANDPEIGKGNTLEVIGKPSQRKQKHDLEGGTC